MRWDPDPEHFDLNPGFDPYADVDPPELPDRAEYEDLEPSRPPFAAAALDGGAPAA